MKILIVNTYENAGGAARASLRLHHALLEANIDSSMLVQSKATNDFTVLVPKNKWLKFFNRFRPDFESIPNRLYKNRSKTFFSSAWLPNGNVVNQINELKPDLVHFHWINEGMMRIEDISKIKAPIVWSLHDMWAFTGGCHYDEECHLYKKKCGNCKVLGSVRSHDLSRKIFNRKKKTYLKKPDMTVVGLSKWLSNCAKDSTLFSRNRVVNLPNPINTKTFAPFDKVIARELLGLPPTKKLILFGAMGAISDPRKGFKELSDALTDINYKNLELVVCGSSKPEKPQGFIQKTNYLGLIHDDITLRLLYSAADVMVVPSIQENLSNSIMESLSCGTPVVGFDIGGNSDLIDHKVNGFLAIPFDSESLASGIEWILALTNLEYDLISKAARAKVEQCFDSRIVSKQYLKLYSQVLDKKS